MADREISSLPKATQITVDSLLAVFVPGAESPAQAATGQQFANFARESVQEFIGQAEAAAEDAKQHKADAESAANRAETARDNVVLDEQKMAQAVSDAEASANRAETEADRAKTEADRAEQVAATNGWAEFKVIDGRVIYLRTDNVAVDFALVDGRLVQICQ